MEAIVFALVAAFVAAVVCNFWMIASVQKLIRQAGTEARDRDKAVVQLSMAHVDQMKSMFTDEVVASRIASKGLAHLAIDAEKRVLAEVAGVMRVLNLSEDQAKDYLRSQIVQPDSATD